MEYYRDLKKRLNDYLKVPSFASKEASKANTITLRWDGSKYSATVTDTNSVLRNFTFENKITGVKITTSGNSMTLSATEPILSPKTSPAIHNNMAPWQSGARQIGTSRISVPITYLAATR